MVREPRSLHQLFDLDGLTAGGSADTEVVTVGPHESMRRAAQLMSEQGVAHLLVARPDSGKPLAVISPLDVAAALAAIIEQRREPGPMRVKQVMRRRPREDTQAQRDRLPLARGAP